MFRTLVLAIGLAAMAGAASAQEVKDFKAWSAVCDNLKTCAAFGYTDDGADVTGFVRLERPAGPAGAAKITLRADLPDGDDGKAPLSWRIAVDGKVPPGLDAVPAPASDGGGNGGERRAVLTPAQTQALIAAIRNGSILTIEGDKAPIAISLSGSSAALLWIDDRQGRVGTVTALAAKGARPATAVPPAPPTPVVRAAPPASQAGLPKRLPAAIRLSPHMKDCDAPSTLQFDPIVARLAPGQVLWGAPCSAGAYNELVVLFIADEQGHGAREIIPPDAQPSTGEADDELMNVGYDPKTRTLSAFAKARGIGDCGAITNWVWDGKAFVLQDETIMPDCHGVGPDDWPSLYHAAKAP